MLTYCDYKIKTDSFYDIAVGEKRVVQVERIGSDTKYEAIVEAIEVEYIVHQCAVYECALWGFASCTGCRCLAGARKDGKTVVFKLHDLYEVKQEQ